MKRIVVASAFAAMSVLTFAPSAFADENNPVAAKSEYNYNITEVNEEPSPLPYVCGYFEISAFYVVNAKKNTHTYYLMGYLDKNTKLGHVIDVNVPWVSGTPLSNSGKVVDSTRAVIGAYSLDGGKAHIDFEPEAFERKCSSFKAVIKVGAGSSNTSPEAPESPVGDAEPGGDSATPEDTESSPEGNQAVWTALAAILTISGLGVGAFFAIKLYGGRK